MLRGIPASPGVAMGRAFLFDTRRFIVTPRKIRDDAIPKEIARFEEALIKTRSEIIGIQKKITKEMGSHHAEIFNAHLLVLEDRMLIEEVIEKLKKEHKCVEHVFAKVLDKYINVFSRMNDEYLKERISDIDDVGKRILKNLMGQEEKSLSGLKQKVIVVAYDLSPSDTATMHKKNVIGFITDIGGRTSHTAIMAKSLEIPAVVGLQKATAKIRVGDFLIVDGNEGIVIQNPDNKTLKKYQIKQKQFVKFEKALVNLKNEPAQTLDGKRVEISANIELPEEVYSVISHGAEGIGLYRTEFLYMNRRGLPSEEEQFDAYKSVASRLSGCPVIIRTLDLGGDKFLSQLEVPHEMNPFLGWRAIRFCLAQPEIFKVQLRAILRASKFGNVKVMFPMISGVEELRQAKDVLNEARKELRRRNIKFDENIEVGAMIEIPSAALTCDILAKEADFFSIGTNDLIQYSLAIDRVNEKIAYLYKPTHPAVLRLIKSIIDAGHREKIWVGMCGEMAGEPGIILILLGLGLDEFSMSPAAVPEMKYIIRNVNFKDAKEVADKALNLPTSEEVEDFANKRLLELIPNLEKIRRQ
ncbi:MAG: phosphoenolpyruvate--protein phosphotransferase [Candidatus Omnitrophica bacterium]|nr:phosphoenolpyruvate--protein phosphotransferase [Candidatus Omnitrophota bacterium]MBU4458236.1 phosphoenolpyruvate--protein phosphotransferase [Candidatus Omnitrophota bacterium]